MSSASDASQATIAQLVAVNPISTISTEEQAQVVQLIGDKPAARMAALKSHELLGVLKQEVQNAPTRGAAKQPVLNVARQGVIARAVTKYLSDKCPRTDIEPSYDDLSPTQLLKMLRRQPATLGELRSHIDRLTEHFAVAALGRVIVPALGPTSSRLKRRLTANIDVAATVAYWEAMKQGSKPQESVETGSGIMTLITLDEAVGHAMEARQKQ